MLKSVLLAYFTLTIKCNGLSCIGNGCGTRNSRRKLIRGDKIFNKTYETNLFPLSYEYKTPTHTTADVSSRPSQQIFPTTAPATKDSQPIVTAGSTARPISNTSTQSITDQSQQITYSLGGNSTTSNQLYPTIAPTTRHESQKYYYSPISNTATVMPTEEGQQSVKFSYSSSETIIGESYIDNASASTTQPVEENAQQSAIMSDASVQAIIDQGQPSTKTETQAQKGCQQLKTAQQVQSSATLQSERMVTPSITAIIIGVVVTTAVVLGVMAILLVAR